MICGKPPLRATVPFCVAILIFTTHGGAEEGTLPSFELREHLNRSWTNELVFYPLNGAAAKLDPSNLRLLDPNGKEIPFQVVKAADGPPRIAFLANLPPHGQATYRLTRGEPAAKHATDIEVKQDKGRLEVTNSRTGVAVPTPEGDYSNGPILAVRMKSGRWIGGSKLAAKRKIASYKLAVLERGPVFADVECLYAFEGGKKWRIRLRMIAHEPVVRISERFDLGDASAWRFLADPGFSPTHGFYRPAYPGKHPRYANVPFALNHAQPSAQFILTPWLEWWTVSRGVFLGLFQAEKGVFYGYDKKVRAPTRARIDDKEGFDNDSPLDDLLIAAAGRAADWSGPKQRARGMNIVLRTDGQGELFFRLPLGGAGREWLLGAGSVDKTFVADRELSQPQALHLKHLVVPLDEVKEMVLAWGRPGPEAYPRLVLGKEQIAALRKAKVGVRDRSLVRRAVKQFAVAGVAAARQSAARVCKAHCRAASGTFTSALEAAGEKSPRMAATTGPHHEIAERVGRATGAADLLLGTDALSPEEKAHVRAQLAFTAYMMSSPHFFSLAEGLHGLPNMTARVCSAVGLIGALLYDHPLAEKWLRMGLDEFERELGRFIGPNGSFLECPHYQIPATDPMLFLAIAAHRAGKSDIVHDARLAKSVMYLAKISTPPDPRFDNRRHLPPIGNTYLMETSSLFGIMARVHRQKNPEYADAMQWMWIQQGRPHRLDIGGENDLHWFSEYLVEDVVPKRAPPWTSELFPAFGAVFRSGFPGDRETYMIYHQGPHHGHYDDDEGSFEMWGKGRPLCLDWGYRGHMPADKHNRVDVGYMGKIVTFAPQAAADYLRGRQGRWTRQILFVKDADPLGPNYFLIRDTVTAPPAKWALWLYTKADPTRSGDVVTAAGQHDVDLDIWLCPPLAEQLKPTGAAAGAGGKATTIKTTETTIRCVQGNLRNSWFIGKTTQKGIHLSLPPGGAFVSLLYPRLRGRKPPTFTALAGGKGVKVASPAGTDYAFLATKPFTFEEGPVRLKAAAGAIQCRGDHVILTLGSPGEIAYGDNRLAAEAPATKKFPLPRPR